MQERMDVPDSAYLQQGWYAALTDVQKALCHKNPTEDLQWRHEVFKTGELPLETDVFRDATLRECIQTMLEVQQGTPITGRGRTVLISRRGGDVE